MADLVTDDVVITVAPDPVVITNDPEDDIAIQTIVDDAVITSSILYDFTVLAANVDEEVNAAIASLQNTINDELAAMQAEIDNELSALSSSLIPSGTRVLFWQAAAPTGWTKLTTHNDKALRVVSGTGGGSGGSYAFSTVFGRYQTDSHAIDGNELTYHGHSFYVGFSDYYQITTLNATGNIYLAGTNAIGFTSITEGGAYVGNAISGNTAAAGASYGHVHGVEMRVQYLDLIICSKDA